MHIRIRIKYMKGSYPRSVNSTKQLGMNDMIYVKILRTLIVVSLMLVHKHQIDTTRANPK